MDIPSYFKSKEEMDFVKREIDNIWLCNEFAELYLEHNEYGFEEIDNYYDKENGEPKEIFQWYMVDGFTARHLESIGEPILNTASHYLWGRTCCGQSIELDGTFQEIYRKINEE